MAKIVRKPDEHALRDAAGKYTAVSYTTKTGEVWLSNKTVYFSLAFVLAVLAMLTGVDLGFAKGLFDWALRFSRLG